MSSTMKSFLARCVVTAAIAGLTYASSDITSVANPDAATTYLTLITIALNVLHAWYGKTFPNS